MRRNEGNTMICDICNTPTAGKLSQRHSGCYEVVRSRGVAIARQVSTVLKNAGFAKRGTYHAFHRRTPGYDVGESGNGTGPAPTARVIHIGDGFSDNTEHANEMADKYAAAIEADGRFTVKRGTSEKYRNSFEVTRKAAQDRATG